MPNLFKRPAKTNKQTIKGPVKRPASKYTRPMPSKAKLAMAKPAPYFVRWSK